MSFCLESVGRISLPLHGDVLCTYTRIQSCRKQQQEQPLRSHFGSSVQTHAFSLCETSAVGLWLDATDFRRLEEPVNIWHKHTLSPDLCVRRFVHDNVCGCLVLRFWNFRAR